MVPGQLPIMEVVPSVFNGLCKPLPLEGLTLMTATDDDTRKAPTGRDAVDRLRSAGSLDGLFEQSWCRAGEHDRD